MQYDMDSFCKAYAERYVLSKAVNDIDYYFTLTSQISERDFLDPRNVILFATLKALNEKGVNKFDFYKIENELQANSATDMVDAKYLDLIYNYMDSDTGNFDIYVTEILEASAKFKLFKKLNNIQTDIIENTKKDIAQLLGEVQSDILELSSSSKSITEPINVTEGLMDYVDERRANPITMSGLPTGYPILDKQIDGLIPGTLFVVAARKKMGKSAFLSNIASHIAFVENKPVLYIDTEMNFKQFRDRLIASVAGVDERIIKHGGFDDDTYNRIRKAMKTIEGKKLFHEYMPGYAVDKITALYKKFKIKEDIQAGFFDYIKEPDSSSVDRQRKEYQILGDVTTRLKDLSGDLDIPFATAIQLNRQGDVADSDRVARYGDIISFWMYQEEKALEETQKRCGSHKLIIKDSRRGGSTTDDGIGFYFFKEALRIKEVPADRQLFNYTADKIYSHGSSENEEELI